MTSECAGKCHMCSSVPHQRLEGWVGAALLRHVARGAGPAVITHAHVHRHTRLGPQLQTGRRAAGKMAAAGAKVGGPRQLPGHAAQRNRLPMPRPCS